MHQIHVNTNQDPRIHKSRRASPGSIHSITISGTQNGDLPADVPLCPAGLPEEPAKANTDQSSPKTGKKGRGQTSVTIHKTCNISSHDMHEGIKEQSVIKANDTAGNQRSLNTTHSQSSGGNHRSVIFRCNNQSTIIVQWSSGTTTHPTTTSMIALDLQVRQLSRPITTLARLGHQSNSGSISHIKAHSAYSLKPRSLKQLPQLYRALSSSKSKLKSVRNHLLKAAQEQKNHWSTIAKISNSATTSRSLNSSIQVSKLISIESPKEYELSATNLAPNGGVNRRRSTEKGSNEHQSYSESQSLKSGRYLRSGRLLKNLSDNSDLTLLRYPRAQSSKRRRVGVPLQTNSSHDKGSLAHPDFVKSEIIKPPRSIPTLEPDLSTQYRGPTLDFPKYTCTSARSH
ncbi:hypothetical protein F511_05552 [Dorcoceras hygrometricum]|uniref:Uncharacterized protein n=1 Tax=Dorcoceras hygrometricum TaxID=472368 RepID=A0A2Z7CEM8_9LAMI|nr:hypothetical protein F511_05552 [Dorcoceras hygrometricum]